jgi:hypothetical protein
MMRWMQVQNLIDNRRCTGSWGFINLDCFASPFPLATVDVLVLRIYILLYAWIFQPELTEFKS